MLDIIISGLLLVSTAAVVYANYRLHGLGRKLNDTQTKLDQLSDKLEQLITILTENKIIEARPNGAVPQEKRGVGK